MKKNFIVRKSHLFAVFINVVCICFLFGCSTQRMETFNSQEASPASDAREHSSAVEAPDTTEPQGKLKVHFIASAGVIKAEDFVKRTKDSSDFTEGFRNVRLLFNEKQVREVLTREIGDRAIPEVELDMDKIFETGWSEDTHLWVEQNAAKEGLEAVIHPEEDGVYSMELVAVDVYGNASVAKVYAMVDTKAPIFTQAEDIEVEMKKDFDEYLQSHEKGLAVEDNLLGDMTTAIYVKDAEMPDSGHSIKVTYVVHDFAGNTATAERIVKVRGNQAQASGVASTQSLTENGLDRIKAEQAFSLVNQQRAAAGLSELAWDESMYNVAVMRAEEILANYSHTRTATGNTTVEDYAMGENLNKLWGDTSADAAVQSWMNSPVHKDNLLIGYYTKTAVACYQNGKYCYYVQLFAY